MSTTKPEFSSNEEFYAFVDLLRDNLAELGFSDAAGELNEILHEIAWTTSSEIFGEIKRALLKVKAEEGHRLPPCLLEDIDVCLRAIELAWYRANRKA
ncbi:MAG: hypothetical protein HY695_24995 [Deltaproteobacteria bacterium]|nr:hypothetical protein [Deltaproteobacteria bacterium]